MQLGHAMTGYTIRVTEKYLFHDLLKIKTRKLRTTQGKRTKSRVHDPILGHFPLNIRLGSRDRETEGLRDRATEREAERQDTYRARDTEKKRLRDR